jgi:hypothetical protein
MTRKDALYIALGSLTAVGLGYLVFWLNKRPGGIPAVIESAKDTITKGPSQSQNTAKTKDATFPLKKGSSGRQVVALQLFLNNADSNNNLDPDGWFGPLTEAAWKNEQRPFETFKMMNPDAINGQVTKRYYDTFVYQFDELYGERGTK